MEILETGKWYSVNEALPRKAGKYRVKMSHVSGEVTLFYVSTMGGKFVWVCLSPENITHWFLEDNISFK